MRCPLPIQRTTRRAEQRCSCTQRMSTPRVLLRLNRRLIPGFEKVERELEALNTKCDALAEASIAAQEAMEGAIAVVFFSVFVY